MRLILMLATSCSLMMTGTSLHADSPFKSLFKSRKSSRKLAEKTKPHIRLVNNELSNEYPTLITPQLPEGSSVPFHGPTLADPNTTTNTLPPAQAYDPIQPAPPALAPGTPLPAPIPDPQFSNLLPSLPSVPLMTDAQPLYHCVEIDDPEKMHPCAVPMIVPVKVTKPHSRLFSFLRKRNCECKCPCVVYVKIMVPPNECMRKECKRSGKTKYKFDDTQIEVEYKNGVVEIDYDD